jgi:hypoxanthine-guanine phosphoribosyltransferase
MPYKFQSLQQILDVFTWKDILWATEIAELTGKSTVIVHKYLKELVTQWKLQKIGIGPRTKYTMVWIEQATKYEQKPELPKNSSQVSYQDKKLLDDIFLKFSPEGNILKWFEGLENWCQERGFDVAEKVTAYIGIYEHLQKLKDHCWLLDAKTSFGHDFDAVYIDQVYYADQYKWMDFWRGKLAEMTFYAKQSQNKKLISESIHEVIRSIECLIAQEGYNAIGIVPWSINRKNQLLKIFKNQLKSVGIPFVNIIKYYPSGIAIPQKSLKTREQRIQNAKNTIFVDDIDIKNYEKVLLLDDFVGSGATLNETAKKLKQAWVKKVDSFAFVGNLNLSYEVINEI